MRYTWSRLASEAGVCSGGRLCCASVPPRFASDRCKTRSSSCATSPLLALRARSDPRGSRRNPRRGFVFKRFLGFSGSRSWRASLWAAKANPNVESSSVTATLWGARRPACFETGSGRARSARRGEGGTLHNTQAFLCNLFWERSQNQRLLVQPLRTEAKRGPGRVSGERPIAVRLETGASKRRDDVEVRRSWCYGLACSISRKS